ncbi:TPA: hypothetical protein QDB15_006259 [Burkholderia vietnamiensis]|jgi:hypothetical protein|nr:hypothetical protein [uncultured bacterium]HDR9122379.1 hypothetical protein [Burkholderia vietnamiensis]BCT98375.1 hypothetical protein [uncultured bacterium]BCT98552.1 hypothetical protein [uncultured bacterium]BCT98604.1 hypothetical protein [uncultured bacterium]
MFKLILVVLAFVAVAALVDLGGSDERAEQARYAAQRIESQDAILTGLQAMNDAAVSEFASDWRKAFPEPSPAKLSELRDIEQRIKNDKAAAVKMTRAYKMKNSPFCNGEVKAVVSLSSPDCPPGL